MINNNNTKEWHRILFSYICRLHNKTKEEISQPTDRIESLYENSFWKNPFDGCTYYYLSTHHRKRVREEKREREPYIMHRCMCLMNC